MKTIQQGVQGNVIHLLSAIWLDEQKYFDLVRVWMGLMVLASAS